jgi:glycosyltransferase involved in cell wall biosynthesis
LKALNKKVISNLSHGSEARPVYIDGAIQNIDNGLYPSLKQLNRIAKKSKNMVSRHEKFVSYIIGAPFSTSHFSQKKFINSFILGNPSLANNLVDSKFNLNNKNPNESIRILHSPSHPIAKGTPIIQNAILNLKKKGYKIEFILIEGLPNSKVVEEIKKCDFVIDQIYSDTPMAGFATEAAIYGKPSVVGGYGFKYLKEIIPEEFFPPSKICLPHKIEEAIESLILDKKQRVFLGKAAQDFVREKRDSTEVARRYLRIIEDDIPENWWLHPNEVIYIEGAGQSLNVTKSNIQNIIKKNGIKGLQLRHNPKLEEAFLKFSR